jgi:hypothetical protein
MKLQIDRRKGNGGNKNIEYVSCSAKCQLILKFNGGLETLQ